MSVSCSPSCHTWLSLSHSARKQWASALETPCQNASRLTRADERLGGRRRVCDAATVSSQRRCQVVRMAEAVRQQSTLRRLKGQRGRRRWRIALVVANVITKRTRSLYTETKEHREQGRDRDRASAKKPRQVGVSFAWCSFQLWPSRLPHAKQSPLTSSCYAMTS